MLYRSHVNYKQRLLNIGLLPLCYWHEFLDLVQVFKCLDSLHPFISVMNSTRPRRNVFSKSTLLNTIRANTVTALRTVFIVEPRESGILQQPTFGTLTVQQRTSKKIFLITTFISQNLFMMSTPPRRLRVCVLSAPLASRPLNSLLDRMCTLLIFLSMSSPILFLHCVSFFFVFKVLSFLLVVLLIFFSFFFLDLLVELAL